MTRTSTAKTADEAEPVKAPAKKTTARRKTAAKTAAAGRTPAKPRTPRARKTTAPDLSLVKPDTTPTAKKTTAKAAARAAAKKTTPWPEFITHKAITAHYQARLHGLPTSTIRAWHENRGVATITLPTGARIDHTPNADAPFYSHTPCKNGGVHYDPVRSITDLQTAEARAKACTDRHGAPAALALGAGLNRAKNTAADTQPTPVAEQPEQKQRALGDELTHSGNGTTDTQPLCRDDIAEGLAERAAATDDKPKEHPEP